MAITLLGLGFVAAGSWGAIIVLLLFLFTTSHYAVDVPSFHAVVLLNALSGEHRVLYQGFHLVLPWEQASFTVDLRSELYEACKEGYPSLDALMEATFVYSVRPMLSGDTDANLVLYSSFGPDVLQRSAKSLLSMLLSDHFAKKRGDELLDKARIAEEVFSSLAGRAALAEFESKHGATLEIRLESSTFDPTTQRFRSMVAGAKTFTEAVEQLVSGGVGRAEAEQIAKLMNLPNVRESHLRFGV